LLQKGLNIKSTYIGNRAATATLSGTSMAAPHTAGLLAYLLSIYPSETFNPDIPSDMVPPSMDQEVGQYPLSAIFTIRFALRAVLPRWISGLLPSLELVAPIPKPIPTLTPLQLKRSLLALGTPDVLHGLPPKTINLLIFNNATLA
jgi:cerevisin